MSNLLLSEGAGERFYYSSCSKGFRQVLLYERFNMVVNGEVSRKLNKGESGLFYKGMWDVRKLHPLHRVK